MDRRQSAALQSWGFPGGGRRVHVAQRATTVRPKLDAATRTDLALSNDLRAAPARTALSALQFSVRLLSRMRLAASSSAVEHRVVVQFCCGLKPLPASDCNKTLTPPPRNCHLHRPSYARRRAFYS